jgi:hypothetical protein
MVAPVSDNVTDNITDNGRAARRSQRALVVFIIEYGGLPSQYELTCFHKSLKLQKC